MLGSSVLVLGDRLRCIPVMRFGFFAFGGLAGLIVLLLLVGSLLVVPMTLRCLLGIYISWNGVCRYRGHRRGVRRKRFLSMFVNGLKPVVNGSGTSENALIKPLRFFCLNIRRIKASTEVATTFSACITTIPVIDSARLGKVSKSTTRILDVILNIPPEAYSFILDQYISWKVPLIDANFVCIDNLQSTA